MRGKMDADLPAL